MSTKSHHIAPPSSKPSKRVITEAEAANGRTVQVLECPHPANYSTLLYDVVVVKSKGDQEVIQSGLNVGEALQAHFRLITKFGGVAKPKSPEEKESEKHKVLDEIIEALETSSVKHGRDLARIEEEKARKANNDAIDKIALKAANEAALRPVPQVYPRKSIHDILKLNYETSAVDAMKALGWDETFTGRMSIAIQMGYRGDVNYPNEKNMNSWLVKKINERFGYELRDRVARAKRKADGPVFTELDWDAHMLEIQAAKDKPSPKKTKEGEKAPSDNMYYMTDVQRHEAKAAGLARLKETPMVKNNRGVYETVKRIEEETKATKAALAKPGKKKWRRAIDKAVQYLEEIDDMAMEELTISELDQELIGFFEDHYGDDWEDLDASEIIELLDQYWV